MHRSLGGVEWKTRIGFTVRPSVDTWYSLVTEDMNGRIAYTNPVWVTVTK
jgi:hypothetical protein